jgi:diaminohydroxyphosphoribosylaminopyrimidine deaminase / 5-amino-6-(5-phosphoribosylamino)uracil reductase
MTDIAATDRLHMARALALAAQGMYSTPPNPRVGSVVVKDGAVIGEGFHARPGQPHAEVNALADARARGNDPRGATLYVTLEPCNSQGRTPPCVDAVIAAGIRRVVAAMRDPNPAQANGGDRLRAAGIDVAFGPLQVEARELNIAWSADARGCAPSSRRASTAGRRLAADRASGSPASRREPTGTPGAPARAQC